MKKQLLSLPLIPDELDIYDDRNKIAELFGQNLNQEQQPDLFFFHKDSIYKLEGYNWNDTEKRKFFIWNCGNSNFSIESESKQIENKDKEIESLKAANKAIAQRSDRIEKERNEVIKNQENLVDRQLFLQAIAAANGKKLSDC